MISPMNKDAKSPTQLIVLIVLFLRLVHLWIFRPTISLPVPDSPNNRKLTFEAATRSIIFINWVIMSDLKMMLFCSTILWAGVCHITCRAFWDAGKMGELISLDIRSAFQQWLKSTYVLSRAPTPVFLLWSQFPPTFSFRDACYAVCYMWFLQFAQEKICKSLQFFQAIGGVNERLETWICTDRPCWKHS